MASAPTVGGSNNTWGSENNAWVGTSLDQTTGLLKDGVALGTNPAASGAFRLPNAKWITGRNAANSGDVNMVKLNALNRVEPGAMINRNDSGDFGDPGAFLKFGRLITNVVSGGSQTIDTLVSARGTGDGNVGVRAYMQDGTGVVNKTITNMTRVGTTVTVTAATHGFANGESVGIYGTVHTFNAEVNGKWVVANVAANTFEITVPGLSSGTYTSGGTTTNRPFLYSFFAVLGPALDRGSLTGTAANNDDCNLYSGYNQGPGKGTDAFYLGMNPSFGTNSAFISAMLLGANADYGIRFPARFVNSAIHLGEVVSAPWGIDFHGTGTFSTGLVRLKNDVFFYGRNAANSADVQVFKFNSLNEFQVQAPIRLSGTVTVSDAINFTFGTGTGTQFGITNSQKMGFWGAAPIARPSAYTQTYSTADKTHATPTAAALSVSVGTGSTTIPDVGAAFSQSTLNNIVRSLADQINLLRNDHLDLAQLANAVIDDLQAEGLAA